jgi:hypothetical protein
MKALLSLAVFTGITTMAQAQIINITNDAGVDPIIGIAVSPAAVASGKDELGNAVNPNSSQYGYSTNGYVNGGMLRGNTPNTYTALTDGDLTTYGDTEYDGFQRTDTDGTAPMGYDFGSAYVGVTGLSTISAIHPVTTIKLTFELDLYGQPGSYFGDNGVGDAAQIGGTGDYFLNLPSTLTLFMQVTTDGTTWTNVAFNSNYASVMNGLDLGNGETAMLSPQVTFNLDSTAEGANIEGIRLIGTVGGGRDDGMLGVADMVVETPEPSTYAMIGLSMAGLFVVGRFIRRASAA